MTGMVLRLDRTEVVGDDAIVFHFRFRNDPGLHTRILGYQVELWQTSDTAGNGERRVGELRLDAQNEICGSHTKLNASLKPNEETPLRLIWVSSPEDLQKIEDHRAGLSPAFRIKPLLLVDARRPTQDPSEQWGREFGWEGPDCGNAWPMLVSIPDREWIALLDKLKFKHNTLDRLKWPALPPAFGRSEEHIAAAWQKHRTGNFDAALNSCYKAFDCLGFNLTGEKVERRDVLELLMDGAEPEKRAKVLEVLKALNSFFHLGRHESGAPVQVTYHDSQFAVTSTTVALSYLAQHYKLRG